MSRALLAVAAILALPASVAAQLEFRGSLESDLRLKIPLYDRQSAFKNAPFERSETSLDGRINWRLNDHVGLFANARLYFTERADPETFGGLTNRQLLEPWRLESDGAFVEFLDVGLDGLDLRFGRQAMVWGTADKFHPTANLVSFDFTDPVKFGKPLANEMLALRYRPELSVGTYGKDDNAIFSELALELVWVPLFKPGQLPNSAGLAFTDDAEFARRANTPLLQRLVTQQRFAAQGGYTFTYNPVVELPEFSGANSQVGARLGWKLFNVDMSLSYYRGYDKIPRAEKVIAVKDGPTHVSSDIHLSYPRVHVLGIDVSTSLDFLDGLGLWAEVGLTWHDDLFRLVDAGTPFDIREIEKEHEQGMFVKSTVGMDYTPFPWWYINVQYVYGFPDEFGATSMKHYLVAGMDFKLARDMLLLRTFTVVHLTGDDASAVLFPQIVVTPWNGGEISVGAFLFLGSESSKFGSAVTGAPTVFMKAKASF